MGSLHDERIDELERAVGGAGAGEMMREGEEAHGEEESEWSKRGSA